MRLLLTRPAEDAARTRAKLEAAGHSVVLSPVVVIEPTGAAWPSGIVDAVLATSGHGFTTLAPTALPTAEARRLMPLFLVGVRTEEMARGCGFLGDAIVAPSAAALVRRMDELIRKPRQLVYLAGHDRKPDVEAALEGRNQRVDTIETYVARAATSLSPVAQDGIRRGTIDAVLHFSRRSAASFVTLVDQSEVQKGRLRHFCLSDDVAGPLREAGMSLIHCAEEPNEAALLAMLPGVAYA